MLDSLPSPSSVGIISDKSARVCRASKAEASSTKDQAYIKLKLMADKTAYSIKLLCPKTK